MRVHARDDEGAPPPRQGVAPARARRGLVGRRLGVAERARLPRPARRRGRAGRRPHGGGRGHHRRHVRRRDQRRLPREVARAQPRAGRAARPLVRQGRDQADAARADLGPPAGEGALPACAGCAETAAARGHERLAPRRAAGDGLGRSDAAGRGEPHARRPWAAAVRDDDGLLRLRPSGLDRRPEARARPAPPARVRVPVRRRRGHPRPGSQLCPCLRSPRHVVLPWRVPAGQRRRFPRHPVRRGRRPDGVLPAVRDLRRRREPDVLRRRRCARQPPVPARDRGDPPEARRRGGRPEAAVPRAGSWRQDAGGDRPRAPDDRRGPGGRRRESRAASRSSTSCSRSPRSTSACSACGTWST